MKHLLKKLFFALVVLLSIFILGMFVPIIISIFITITTDATLQDCIQTVPFILFSVIGVIIAGCYVNEEIIPNI